MISFILVFIIFVFAIYNKNTFLAILFLPSIYFYFLAYELRNSSLVLNYFEFVKISDFSLYLFIGFCLTISTFIAFSKLPRLKTGLKSIHRTESYENYIKVISFKKLTNLYYVLSVISISAFLINFNRVNFDINLMFILPRMYEETFGQSTYLNYLYFLNVPALCLFIYSKVNNHKIKYAIPLNVALILISFFHGIKFTVFDTLLIPSFYFYHLSEKSNRKLFFLFSVFSLLLVFYLGFSFFVRGSYNESSLFTPVLNYILPNYYNLAYAFEISPIQFDPIFPLLPDKTPNPFEEFFYYGEFGFILNDKYNMVTAFNIYYSLFPFLSIFFLLPFIVGVRYRILKKMGNSYTFHHSFYLTYIDFCLFFSWYFFAFNKTKYVYYLFIIWLLSKLIYRSKNLKLINI